MTWRVCTMIKCLCRLARIRTFTVKWTKYHPDFNFTCKLPNGMKSEKDERIRLVLYTNYRINNYVHWQCLPSNHKMRSKIIYIKNVSPLETRTSHSLKGRESNFQQQENNNEKYRDLYHTTASRLDEPAYTKQLPESLL